MECDVRKMKLILMLRSGLWPAFVLILLFLPHTKEGERNTGHKLFKTRALEGLDLYIMSGCTVDVEQRRVFCF